MKILLTGASGFLGTHIREVLKSDEIVTIGRHKADITMDITSDEKILPKVDLVIHSAGKAHFVPKTKEEGSVFFEVNYKGTINFLKNIESNNAVPGQFVFISSVSVYGLISGNNINESHPLLAIDPYGLSKIRAEEYITEWCERNNVICTILRLPLLIGKSPVGNLYSMINGIKKGFYFNVGDGSSRKSMVRAYDVANIIHAAARQGGIYNLTDGVHPSFSQLSEFMALKLGKRRPWSLPKSICKIIASVGDLMGDNFPINSNKLRKINATLTFDDSKARTGLNWNPVAILDSTDFDN